MMHHAGICELGGLRGCGEEGRGICGGREGGSHGAGGLRAIVTGGGRWEDVGCRG